MNIIKNSRHTITITKLSDEGVGVGHLDGIPVFVEMAITGELVDIKIIKVTKRYAVGKLVNIVQPAVDRVQPFCPVFKRCGGCSLQHVTYRSQLALKTDLIKERIRDIEGFEEPVIHEILGMQTPLGYRNKAQYPVGEKQGEIVLGFYAKRSHEIIEHAVCGIQPGIIDDIVAIIRQFFIDQKISIYHEIRHIGLIRHLMIRVGYRSREVMVTIVINGDELPEMPKLLSCLLTKIPEITSIVLNINKKHSNVILGQQNIIVYGTGKITDMLGAYRFEISPQSFYQINPLQTEILYQKVLEYAGLTGEEIVLDAYCGIGTISIFLADHADKVYGVDVGAYAIRDAQRNAEINSLKNIEFFQGEVKKMIPKLSSQGIHTDVVVVDPPRKGCDETLLETLIAMQPQKIVYVSCQPKTLVRDLKWLATHEWFAVEIQPVDMFPHTTHIECVANIEPRKKR